MPSTRCVVDRDGQVILPEVGALKVWGMKFGDLEGYLQHELSRKYTDFKMSVTMDRLRTIRVFVVGEAAAPSTYTVSSLSTVINALFAAGRPLEERLSSARSGLRATTSEPVELDLYGFLLGGDKTKDVRLQDGDTIFIPLIGPVVGVAGNVKRPAIYEMVGPMTLRQVLDLAGGVTFSGWLQRVQVERVSEPRAAHRRGFRYLAGWVAGRLRRAKHGAAGWGYGQGLWRRLAGRESRPS